MAKQDPSSQDKSNMLPWFLNDLRAKGFYFKKIEDCDVPPEESYGSVQSRTATLNESENLTRCQRRRTARRSPHFPN